MLVTVSFKLRPGHAAGDAEAVAGFVEDLGARVVWSAIDDPVRIAAGVEWCGDSTVLGYTLAKGLPDIDVDVREGGEEREPTPRIIVVVVIPEWRTRTVAGVISGRCWEVVGITRSADSAVLVFALQLDPRRGGESRSEQDLADEAVERVNADFAGLDLTDVILLNGKVEEPSSPRARKLFRLELGG